MILTALAGDGSVLRELPVGLHERMPLSVRLPEGTRTVRLEGTNAELPRQRVVLGPRPGVVTTRVRRRWRLL